MAWPCSGKQGICVVVFIKNWHKCHIASFPISGTFIIIVKSDHVAQVAELCVAHYGPTLSPLFWLHAEMEASVSPEYELGQFSRCGISCVHNPNRPIRHHAFFFGGRRWRVHTVPGMPWIRCPCYVWVTCRLCILFHWSSVLSLIQFFALLSNYCGVVVILDFQ